mmetsp:Transcript_30091/g.73100  ORF Transcript_30091/g.73100 Transcript_30091/m.73100 type:complete len:648 (-) Transcript_30091:141-2084(-)
MKMTNTTIRRPPSSQRLLNLYFVLSVSVLVLLSGFAATDASSSSTGSSSSSSSNNFVVRIRLPSGSVEKIQLEDGQDETLTISDILKPFDVIDDDDVGESEDDDNDSNSNKNDRMIRIGQQKDGVPMNDSASMSSKTLKDWGIRHGTIITVPPLSSSSSPSSITARKQKQQNSADNDMWHPYPDLAKDEYEELVRKSKTRRGTVKSYGDVAQLQSSLHIVEPQQEGPIKRIYLCRKSAERFYSNGIERPKNNKGKKKKPTTSTNPAFIPRVGMLLGTIQKERAEGSIPKKARTSLSSTTKEDSMCQVIKVQAVWEPTTGQQQSSSSRRKNSSTTNNKSKPTTYDSEMASQMLSTSSSSLSSDNSDEIAKLHSRVLILADRLGLQPVGWIFSTVSPQTAAAAAAGGAASTTSIDDYDTDDDQVPVNAIDVWTGAKLQIENMRRVHNNNDNNGATQKDINKGDKFVSVSMDAETGTTEAFQLSHVTIQMVHDDVFASISEDASSSSDKNKKNMKGGSSSNPKIVSTRHPVLVDGRETKELDSVLCLINTALLSHDGSFSGSSSASSVKKSNGTLTNKTKKDLLALMEKDDDRSLMATLCDFNLLLALDSMLEDNDMAELCELVRKWSRGQKQGTAIGPKLKMKLQSLLA